MFSSSRPKGQTLTCFLLAPSLGTIYCRTLQAKNVSAPSLHRITAARRASYSVRVIHRATVSPSWLTGISVLVYPWRSRTCVIALVYDVSNRESFEALPRWLEELENYVPPEVVKIVVGNKLDKVRGNDPESISPPYSPLITIILLPADR